MLRKEIEALARGLGLPRDAKFLVCIPVFARENVEYELFIKRVREAGKVGGHTVLFINGQRCDVDAGGELYRNIQRRLILMVFKIMFRSRLITLASQYQLEPSVACSSMC